MAELSKSAKLGRLVKVQRHLEHMAESDLAVTTKARAEIADDLDAVVNAIGSVDTIHQLFTSIYSGQISRLTAKDQHLQTVQQIQEQKILREKAKADRLAERQHEARDAEDGERQEAAIQELIDIRLALGMPGEE
jgi:cysteinyl-tRNA synthetase